MQKTRHFSFSPDCGIIEYFIGDCHFTSYQDIKSFKLLISIFGIIMVTVTNWRNDKNISLYNDKKIITLIRKIRRPRQRSQTLLIAPKLCIFFYIFLTHGSRHPGKDNHDCLKSNKRHFFNVEFLKFCKQHDFHFMNELMSEVALSKLKIQKRNKFFKFLLLLSGDIELNPGPTQLDNKIFTCFKEKGLHFFHLNINSVLKKVDELRIIAKESNAAVIGLTETKLDETVLNEEIKIEGYV